ncbi:MAG TPA: PorV/PorQ family protein [Ignavibacteriaceae bacterium]|nr:PorV/PorQ family protein [Ignavibacteriaceae bacterium]HPO55297.1 PorV/PorQ family protein [Ignavibacteriaceae bacterium]
MKKFIIIAIILTATAVAQYSNLGSAGAQFLQIPVGARATAMGGAYIGIADDASAFFWNPAGLTGVNNFDAHFSYLNWFDLFDISSVAVAYNLPDVGVFTVGLTSVTSDKMEITTETQPNGTGMFFDASDMVLGIAYSRKLTDMFSVGVTAKYVYQRIWNEVADGLAFDLGTRYELGFQNMVIAMSLSNFGPDMKFEGPDLNINYSKDPNLPLSRLAPAKLETDNFALPLHFQVGLSGELYKSDFIKIRGSIDVTHPNDNKERINVGTEIGVFDRLYLRGGYRINYDDEQATFGAGTNLPFSGVLVTFDYSYSIYDILPNVQRISLGVRF